jgi:putative endopeptidase
MKLRRKNWGFDTKTMDTKVRPQDDFYTYAHGAWLKKTKIPASESRWGSFIILRVEVEKQLKALVEKLEKGHYPKGSPEQMTRDFYKAGLDEKAREKRGLSPIAPWVTQILAMQNTEDLQKLIIEFHRLGIGALWGGFVDQDSKDSSTYLLHLYQDGLGMPDRDYYLKDDKESLRVRSAYMKHVEAMHRLYGQSAKEALATVKTVMKIETALAQVSMTKEDARDSEKVYHKLCF